MSNNHHQRVAAVADVEEFDGFFRCKTRKETYLKAKDLAAVHQLGTFLGDRQSLHPSMYSSVALCAERDQVLFRVVAGVAAKLFVVNLQIRHRAARLTAPAIAAQHLLLKILIRKWVEPNSARIRKHRGHDAVSFRPPRNACLCSPGRNLKNLVIENNRVSGSPLSRLAPARKSAQIISRQ